MIRIIDMECSVPREDGGEVESTPAKTEDARAAGGASETPGSGMANYRRIFRSRREGSERPAMDMDAYLDMLGKLGIQGDDKIARFALDSQTGDLDPLAEVAGPGGPVPLRIYPVGARPMWVSILRLL